MIIDKIEKVNRYYQVTFRASFFEKLFGVKNVTRKYIDSGNCFILGGGVVYIRDDGKKLNNWSEVGQSIDKWRRQQQFESHL